MRHADGVTQGGDLVADTLKGIAEIASVDDNATSDGCALGLISNQSNVHNLSEFGRQLKQQTARANIALAKELLLLVPHYWLFFVAVVVVNADE